MNTTFTITIDLEVDDIIEAYYNYYPSEREKCKKPNKKILRRFVEFIASDAIDDFRRGEGE